MTHPSVGGSEKIPPVFRLVDSAFSLSEYSATEHVIETGTDKQFIRFQNDVPYPADTHQPSLRDVLLEKDPSRDNGFTYLELPDNYAAMAHALNDAIGDRPSWNSGQIAYDLFRELGFTLDKITKESRLIPAKINYRQIIFLKDQVGVKLLPPLEMVQVESFDQAREQVVIDLWESCVQGTFSEWQRQRLSEAFQGFVEQFTLL